MARRSRLRRTTPTLPSVGSDTVEEAVVEKIVVPKKKSTITKKKKTKK